ncbi:MAG: hypothetical protein P8074_23475 [Anaerolineales bacterium]|jgi:hypothetical protein
MNKKQFLWITVVVVPLIILTALALMASSHPESENGSSNALVQAVRQGTEVYKDDVEAAEAAGHGQFLGCVSGASGGAMGLHYPNGDLVADPTLDPSHPEVLIYEVKNGKYSLVGVEFLVLAEDWNANNDSPPVLLGQVFNYSGSPNRYGLPAFYELHVWAWQDNPNGVFADWNPKVSCEGYSAD